MKKFQILMPCYNDWSSVFKLLQNIDKEVSNLKGIFSVLIVNDGSTDKMPKLEGSFKNIQSIQIMNIKVNQGHTRSNATGIKYFSKNGNFDYIILMDGDGEDRPEEIKLLVEKALYEKNISVVAKRIKRSEGFVFAFFYHLHKLITLIFTGKNMNFGHYSCLTKKDIAIISSKKNLWGNFSGTVKKFIDKLVNIPCIRGKRYVQPSKMSFIKLIVHSFSILAVFKYQVLLRSTLFFILIFLFTSDPYRIFFESILIIFTTLVFFASKLESAEKLENCEQNIANIKTVHPGRL